MYRNIRNSVIFFAVLSMIAILIGSGIIKNNSWESLVTSYEEKRSQQVQHFMEDQVTDLKGYMYIHSKWSDAQENLLLENHEWLEANATGYLLEDPSFNVDFVFATTEVRDFEEVYGGDYGDVVAETKVYKRALYNDEMGSEIIEMDSGYMVIVASPIFDSKGENPMGVYLLGRLLDEDIINHLFGFLGKKEAMHISFDSKPAYLESETDSFENLRMSEEFPIGASNIFVNMEFKVPAYRYLFVETQRLNYLIIVIIILMFTGLLLFTLKRMAKYMMKTLEAVEGVSNGDYSTKIDIKSNRFLPELNRLEQSVNRMSLNLESQSETIHRNYTEMVELVVKSVEINDAYTYRHNISVAEYSVAIGRKMGFDAIDSLETAAKFHDVGKISVPTQVLNKPGKLTKEEYKVVMRHPVEGYNLIKKVKHFERIALGVRHHHERYDGKGYPDGLKGDEIPKMAQIIAVADNFDAMTSDRVYRKAMSREKATSIIEENSGKMFSPDVVEAFLQYVSSQNEKEESS